MKLRDLFEAQNYEEMFNFLNNLDIPANDPYAQDEMTKIKGRIEERIQWAKAYLKRKDRITWYLRWLKLWAINRLEDDKTMPQEMLPKLMAQKAKLNIDGPLGDTKLSQLADVATSMAFKESMLHFLSLPITAIQTYQWTNQSPYDIRDTFEKLENKWKEESKGTVTGDDGKLFLTVDSTLAWYDLETPYSEIEACAQGHCGNRPNAHDSDQTILSLRQKLPNGLYKVCLTFVLHKENGVLGEMKGRGNTKPAEQYHEAIVKLITDPRIKGIIGGGYAAESNFSIFDLGDAEAKKLLDEKPRLAPIGEYIGHFGVDNKIMTELSNIFATDDNDVQLNTAAKEVLVKVADNMEDLAANYKNDTDAYWLFKYTVENDFYEVHDFILRAEDIERNLDKETEIEFLAKAKVALKGIKVDEEDLDTDDIKSVLDWLEENDEDAWQIIQNCAAYAEESAVQSAMYKFMMKSLNSDTFECYIDFGFDIGNHDGGGNNMEGGFAEITKFDDPVWFVLSLSDLLKNASETSPSFSEISAIRCYPQIKFEEPRYGFDGDSKVFDQVFNEKISEEFNEIFGSYSPQKKVK